MYLVPQTSIIPASVVMTACFESMFDSVELLRHCHVLSGPVNLR